MAENTVRKIEQGRADFAFNKVKQVKDKDFAKDYKSHVKRLPMMIKMNGLAAALSFMFSKAEKKDGESYKKIMQHCKEWLIEDNKKLIGNDANADLVEKVIKLDTYKYKAVTNEIIALTGWLKRYADGMIGSN